MATIYPFRALRPRPGDAARIAAVPYDVVTTDEARELAQGNPLSFLRVSRAEIELPAAADPHGDAVYDRAAANFAALKASALEVEAEPSVYFYRLRMGTHEQIGLAACFSLDEYDRDIIKKHERTRRDKEDDRTRHMLALRAQTGPVFLTYKASDAVDAITARSILAPPLFDFTATDGVQHTLWRASAKDRDALVSTVADIPALYIADGHHRAASAARARAELLAAGESVGDSAGFDTVLAVAFPHDQVQILPYNRVVKDLAGWTHDEFIERVRATFEVTPGPATPARAGDISMHVGSKWLTLRAKTPPDARNPIGSLDVSGWNVAKGDGLFPEWQRHTSTYQWEQSS